MCRCLNDASFPFTYSADIYAGRPPDHQNAPYYKSSLDQVCVGLLEKYGMEKLAGTTLAADNLYSSLSLIYWLLENDITYTGIHTT